ncbi:MAG: IS1634 family transposase [Candidatus Helarchaeota archaeon]
MVFIERKTKKGKTVLYLTHKARINGKSKRVLHIYLGPEERFLKHAENIKLELKPDFEIATYDFGMPVVLMKLAERLDLINIINKCTPKRQQGLSVGEYILIATLNRCIKPRSKKQIKKWFYSTYLQRKFPKIETYLDSMAYTNHFQYLTEESIDKIEEKINSTLLTEFKVSMDQLLYDPTNFFTFINPKEQALPRHGKSKEGRNTLNLVSLSIFCTRDGGVPVMHHVYPGGVHDAKHFKTEYPKFLARLQKLGISTAEITLVFDKGNISEEVFQIINSSRINWIVSVRPSSHKDLHKLVPKDFEMFKLPNGKEVGLLEFKRRLFNNPPRGPECRLIVTYNPRRARLAAKNLRKKLEAKIDEVNDWFMDKGKLNVKMWRSRERVENKIKDIIHSKAYLEFISYKVTGEFSQIKYTIKINDKAFQKHVKTLGKSFFMTNHPKMSPLEIVWLYRQQFTVERAFKYLKNPDSLRITPMFHHKDECIRGHLFTCILGLLLLTLLCRDVKKAFPEWGLPTIIELLSIIS